MASSSNNGSPKRLVELLGEEQDPFVLDRYLLERGYRPKSLELQRNEEICGTTNTKYNLTKLLKRNATSHGQNSPSCKSSRQFSNFARNLFTKFISTQVLRLKNTSVLGTRKHDSNSRIKNNQEQKEANELNRFSNDSSVTVGNNSSESEMDTENITSPSNDANSEIAQGVVMTQWRPVEENKQHSPVSVLDNIEFVQNITVYNGYGNEIVREEEKPYASKTRIQNTVSDDSIWELLISSQRNRTKQSRTELLLPQLINSKKSLEQTRQLLFDCVTEVVENQNKKQSKNTMRKQKGLMTGPEEMGKIICNKLRKWGEMKLSNDETNLKQVLSRFEEEEWSDIEVYRKDIAFQIGDCLFEEIKDEVVSDFIGQF